MNVNVHGEGGRYWNLGLKRVQGSMPAERCVELLQAKLAEFGLSLEKDIVCVCTDGASVMSIYMNNVLKIVISVFKHDTSSVADKRYRSTFCATNSSECDATAFSYRTNSDAK